MASRLYTAAEVRQLLGDSDDENDSDIDVEVIISYMNVSSTILSKHRARTGVGPGLRRCFAFVYVRILCARSRHIVSTFINISAHYKLAEQIIAKHEL